MKRDKNFDKSILLLAAIFLVILATGVVLYLQVRTDKITDALQQKKPINTLFVVHDGDSLVFSEVFLYHPETYGGAIFDVPGNLGLIIESINRFDRIDVLYNKGNLKAFREKIEKVAGIQIPFTIEMSLEDVEHMTDLVEGLELFIANPVELLEQEVPVLLPSGSVVLDGSKVRTYVSFEDAGETKSDSISRKQRFLQALLKAIGQKSAALGHESVFPYFRDVVSTNMDSRALRAFIDEMYRLDADRIIFHHVLGTEREVDDQRLLFPHFDGELFRGRISQIMDTLASTDIVKDGELALTLQILNGTDISGFAGRTARLFQNFGFTDTIVGNADSHDIEHTTVIDRRGNIAAAQKVADIIKCSRVESIPDDTLDDRVDITILLGKDFDGRYVK